MEIQKIEPLLIRAGFVLFTVALLTGFAVPAFLNPRMAVAGHLTAILNAIFLMVLGLIWGLLVFNPIQAKLTKLAFLYGAFASWVTSCLAAAWGTSRETPVSGAGYIAAPWKEALVASLQVSIVLVILAGALSVLYALRPKTDSQGTPALPSAASRPIAEE
jgi:(hydroxyamino)benzene mutase